MKIVLVLVPSPDCWRERLLGTSTKTGFKGLRKLSPIIFTVELGFTFELNFVDFFMLRLCEILPFTIVGILDPGPRWFAGFIDV